MNLCMVGPLFKVTFSVCVWGGGGGGNSCHCQVESPLPCHYKTVCYWLFCFAPNLLIPDLFQDQCFAQIKLFYHTLSPRLDFHCTLSSPVFVHFPNSSWWLSLPTGESSGEGWGRWAPTLFVGETEAQRAEKNYFWEGVPLLFQESELSLPTLTWRSGSPTTTWALVPVMHKYTEQICNMSQVQSSSVLFSPSLKSRMIHMDNQLKHDQQMNMRSWHTCVWSRKSKCQDKTWSTLTCMMSVKNY